MEWSEKSPGSILSSANSFHTTVESAFLLHHPSPTCWGNISDVRFSDFQKSLMLAAKFSARFRTLPPSSLLSDKSLCMEFPSPSTFGFSFSQGFPLFSIPKAFPVRYHHVDHHAIRLCYLSVW